MINRCPYAFVRDLTDRAIANPAAAAQQYFNGDDLLTIEIIGGIPHYFLECRGVYSADGAGCIEPSPRDLIEILRSRL